MKVTLEEKELIHKKMKQCGISNRSSYLKRMALGVYIINLDLEEVREMTRLLSNFTNNVNQIARRVNQTGNIYAEELSEIKEKCNVLWEQQEKILTQLSKV
jgi:hypothetical protein